ncbi:helix-turn-helix domain-containing protein [Chryseobacterium mucoviscidosis]|uniref:HTH cro/C1-type domain-containing protein n=1 Tax=Chryseobacterium mucoviscidosis TaxID=1945581 RepID=A0A202BWX3_9FLAO|nr:helix-turn-helix transcriptional regulator [Chryseobacterium mucoviscidosis]OVE55970.1 hypothetical protein B0E34_17325 [Chryseobacterium mucoviscidosis]
MKIHEKLREYSKSKGETLRELADEYGMTPQAIQLYFAGKNAIPLNFLVWYLEKHPDLDLYALFDKNRESIVSEPKAPYNKKTKKQELIDRIVEILQKEM